MVNMSSVSINTEKFQHHDVTGQSFLIHAKGLPGMGHLFLGHNRLMFNKEF
jgi:hypothetical protein